MNDRTTGPEHSIYSQPPRDDFAVRVQWFSSVRPKLIPQALLIKVRLLLKGHNGNYCSENEASLLKNTRGVLVTSRKTLTFDPKIMMVICRQSVIYIQ